MKRAVFCGLVLLVSSAVVQADGGYFAPIEITLLKDAPPPSSDVQQAYLMHFDGMETLCLLSNYRGPKADFAWVIPVPSRPEVTKGNRDILSALEQMTRPKLATRSGPGVPMGCSAPPAGEVDLGVTVLEAKRLGELESVILSARDGRGLVQWLTGKGFHVPDKARPVLDEYVQQGFCFVALRFSGTALRAPAGEDAGASPAASGHVGETDGVFLELRFATEKPFFPLAISSITAAADSEILLLTITEHRQEPIGCDFMELSEMKAGLRLLASRPKLPAMPLVEVLKEEGRHGRPVFAVEAALPSFAEFDADGRPGMQHLLQYTGRSRVRASFITRFHAVMGPEQMTRDVYFRDAAKDVRLDGVIEVADAGRPQAIAAALAIVPLALRGLGRRTRTRRRTRLAMMLAVVALVALA
ncbi:MAG: DUF2330 domain-containing protein [Planctomycetes bacterium]|nr:DUF2330 domain-containing protein [Planctomycetota bacterium]